MSLFRAVLFALKGLLCFAFVTAAHGSDATDAIARLLDVGWSQAPQARSAADAEWLALQRLAPSDVRAIEASWLVLMQQRRFEEALKRLGEHLAKEPNDLSALRAKAWVQTVLKNYPAAFLTADRLSSLLAAHRVTNDADLELHNDTIGFLGRLAGFFGGPAADSINQDERKSLEKKWLDRLEETNRPLFEDARNAVLAKYLDMTGDSADARQSALETANAEKAKTLAELQTDREKLEAHAKSIEERRQKLNSELKAELDEIAKQDQPLVQQQSQLSSRGSALESDLLSYSAQIAGLQQLAAQEKSAFGKQQYFNQISNLNLIAGRIDIEIANIGRSLRGLQAQRASLVARQAQAKSAAARQVAAFEKELADLGKRERRNDGLEKRATRATVPTTSKARSLSAQATALSTYDSFPLEAAKARLLESLR
jgi:hypothetical protein